MASYYYLISSLPELTTSSDMPISYSEFLNCCQSNVSDAVYQLLSELTLNSENGPLVKEWSAFYHMLTKELNFQRSANLGKQYAAGYDKDAVISQVVSAALNARNPLEAEKILLDYEFEVLDSMVGLHMFDDHVLFGYAIKLKLLERQDCFEQKKGKKEFESLFNHIQEQVYSL